MRIFLLILLGLNLLYFLYQWISKDDVVAEGPVITRGVADIPLLVRLSEVNNPPEALSPTPLDTHLPEQNTDTSPELLVSGRYCYTIGPFAETELMEVTKNQLMASGISADSRESKERKQRGYWVYLPAYPDREEALAVSRDLAANGLKDYFIINDEKNRHAISLGLFSKKSGSERRIREIKAMGYYPELEIRYRQETIYWLDYETVEPFNGLIGLTSSSRDKSIQQHDRECS